MAESVNAKRMCNAHIRYICNNLKLVLLIYGMWAWHLRLQLCYMDWVQTLPRINEEKKNRRKDVNNFDGFDFNALAYHGMELGNNNVIFSVPFRFTFEGVTHCVEQSIIHRERCIRTIFNSLQARRKHFTFTQTPTKKKRLRIEM